MRLGMWGMGWRSTSRCREDLRWSCINRGINGGSAQGSDPRAEALGLAIRKEHLWIYLLHSEMTMTHPIHRVRSFQIEGPYTLRVRFDDGTDQVIDFAPVLGGELFRPLRELSLFNQV